MKALRLLLCAAVAACAAAPLPAAVLVDLSVGTGAFREEAWDPQKTQSPLGVGMRWEPDGRPVSLEARIRHIRSREEAFVPYPVGNVAFDLLADSLSLGAVVARRGGVVRPFAGGGLEALRYRRCLFDNDFPGGRIEDDGTAASIYLHAGILWAVGGRLLIGLEGRAAGGGEVTLTDLRVVPGVSFSARERDREAAYAEIVFRLGWVLSGRRP